jgi:hypothetical protein
MFVGLNTMSEEAGDMRTAVGCSQGGEGQTDFWMPSVFSLGGCASGTGTSCGRSDLFIFAFIRRLVAASI